MQQKEISMELTADGNLGKCEKVEEFSQMTTTARGIEGGGGEGQNHPCQLQ